MMDPYFAAISSRPDRTNYSDVEWHICRLLTEEGIRGRALALDELEELKREDPGKKNIQSGSAALEALSAAIDRPIAGLFRAKETYDPDKTLDTPLFQALAEQCTEEALQYFVRHHDSGADCGVMWNKLMEKGDTILPGEPLPESVKNLLLKSCVFLYEPLIFPTGFRLLHEARPDFRLEQEGADALLRTVIFLKYRAKALGGTSPRSDDLLECWKALSPEPCSLAPLDEFAEHIRDHDFVGELRAVLL